MNITSKKVIQFYESNPCYSLNDMNELLVDLLVAIKSQTSQQKMDESAITILLNSINQKCNSFNDTIIV